MATSTYSLATTCLILGLLPPLVTMRIMRLGDKVPPKTLPARFEGSSVLFLLGFIFGLFFVILGYASYYQRETTLVASFSLAFFASAVLAVFTFYMKSYYIEIDSEKILYGSSWGGKPTVISCFSVQAIECGPMFNLKLRVSYKKQRYLVPIWFANAPQVVATLRYATRLINRS